MVSQLLSIFFFSNSIQTTTATYNHKIKKKKILQSPKQINSRFSSVDTNFSCVFEIVTVTASWSILFFILFKLIKFIQNCLVQGEFKQFFFITNKKFALFFNQTNKKNLSVIWNSDRLFCYHQLPYCVNSEKKIKNW